MRIERILRRLGRVIWRAREGLMRLAVFRALAIGVRQVLGTAQLAANGFGRRADVEDREVHVRALDARQNLFGFLEVTLLDRAVSLAEHLIRFFTRDGLLRRGLRRWRRVSRSALRRGGVQCLRNAEAGQL